MKSRVLRPRSAALRLPLIALPLALVLTAGLTTAFHAGDARAQYEWSDENGRKVYSDVPPAPGARASNLIRRGERPATPGAHATEAGDGPATLSATSATSLAPQSSTAPVKGPAPGTPGSGAPTTPASPARPLTSADREMAFRKRQAERAEAEQKQVAQAATDRKNSAACDDGRSTLRSLESGQRISRTDASGERAFISDEEREARIRSLKADLASRC